MDVEVYGLHPLFAAELIGADLAQPLSPAFLSLVEELMREHAVLVIRDQGHVGDDAHVAFSEAFGPLELPPGYDRMKEKPGRFRPELYDASNLDENGEIAPADSLRHKFARGNELFHSDASFNDHLTSWSLLFCHIPPAERGETEFVDGRAVWEALPTAMKARLDGLWAEHNVWISRERTGYPQAEGMKAMARPVRHPVVKTSPSGRKTLFIGAHLYRFDGMTARDSQTLLDELMAFAAQPRFVYSHSWLKGDLVIWDNRCTLHRAAEFDYLGVKRDLRRTTILERAPAPAEQDRKETVDASA